MYEHTVRVLEFEKIRSRLLEYCLSEEGREHVSREGFLFDPQKLEIIHNYVEEIHDFLHREDLPSFDFPAVLEPCGRLKTEGAVLEGEEIYLFARYFLSARRLKKYLQSAENYDYSLLPEEAGLIDECGDLYREITSVLNPDGTVKETHPGLRRLRTQLSRFRSELNHLAGSYMHSNSQRWQSDVPTQRDGRMVLPLKAQFRGTVNGIIHYSSARGSTVYIEPPEIMAKNNDVALLEQEIREIIHAILRELSAKLAARYTDIESLIEQIVRIDTFLCRGRYALISKCTRADHRTRGFKLKMARHPLLREKAVPIDIETGEDVQALIISGPNAGGKTVTLKTVGLFVLMNQFGMQIPAEEGSELAVFSGVYADIGDEQSIEGSISTFSGHMQTISDMLSHADTRALVLLDELGSGTDPGEGASLAMSIMDECIHRGATLLATTHHSLLKNYGYTTPNVQNASMDFDSTTLAPNYRVIVGFPGESHAFDIAARSGLPEQVIEKARHYMSSDSGEVGRMIRELEKKQTALREMENQLSERETQLRQQIKEHDLSVLSLRRKEHDLKEQGYGDLNRFLRQSRQELENLVSELRRKGVSGIATKEVKQFIDRIGQRDEAEKTELEHEELEFAENRDHNFEPGMEVMTRTGHRKGVIVRATKKSHWLVEVGAMKVSLPESELTPVSSGGHSAVSPPQVSYGYSSDSAPPAAVFMLDIRGKRLDEALDMVNRQIDNALLASLYEFEIVHGRGEGILQTGVRRLLKESSRVEEYYFARPELGGTGKTIVKLKQ